MADAHIMRQFALEDVDFPVRRDFAIEPFFIAARFILRGGPAAASAAGEGFGLVLPDRPHQSAQDGARSALWLGPDEWLLMSAFEDARSVMETLAGALAGVPHSLVDVSHRQVGLTVSGPQAARVINAGCPLDLGLSAFPVGMATRTILAKAEIVLWRVEPTRFHIEVWRSFSGYAATFLIDAVRGAPDF